MVLFDWNDKEYVIVAVGEYCMLRRELPDGEWQVFSVLLADKPIENK